MTKSHQTQSSIIPVWEQNPVKIDPLLVDERTAAAILGLSPRTVFDLRKQGELKIVKLKSAVRYPVESLKAFIERQAFQDVKKTP